MKLFTRVFLITIFCLLTFGGQLLYGQTKFCPLDLPGSVDEWLNDYKAAKSVLPKNTAKIDDMSVFVTVHGKELYLQSNYAPPELATPSKIEEILNNKKGELNPFKLVVDDSNLSLVYWTKVLTDPRYYYEEVFNNEEQFTEFKKDHPNYQFEKETHETNVSKFFNKGMTIYVEEKLFKDPKWRDLDFGTAKVELVGLDNRIYPTIPLVEQIVKPGQAGFSVKRWVNPQPYTFADIKQSNIMFRFKKTSFRTSDIRVLSLVQDQATLSSIKTLIPAANRMSFDNSSVTTLKNAFANNRGKTIFVIGHIPERSGKLVVENSSGAEVFSISINEIEQIAKDNNSTLFVLGCKSVEAGKIGVINEINSVDAVTRLNRAMTSTNYGDFISQIAGQDFGIVVNEAILNGATYRISMKYEQKKLVLTTLSFGGAALGAGTMIVVIQSLNNDEEERRKKN